MVRSRPVERKDVIEKKGNYYHVHIVESDGKRDFGLIEQVLRHRNELLYVAYRIKGLKRDKIFRYATPHSNLVPKEYFSEMSKKDLEFLVGVSK
jgi:hypothetical protein